jgi:hypothetical protein
MAETSSKPSPKKVAATASSAKTAAKKAATKPVAAEPKAAAAKPPAKAAPKVVASVAPAAPAAPVTAAEAPKKTAKAVVAAAPKKPAAAKRQAVVSMATPGTETTVISDEQRYRMIAEAAYYRAESNAFKSDPVRDWIEAEAAVAAMLNTGK